MFDSLPLHPKLVHFPIALSVLVPVFSAVLLIAWWRGWLPARSWLIAVALQAVLVGTAYLAMETGEHDEELVESVVAESVIEAHEEAAEVFLWAGVGVLVLFLAGATMPRRGVAIGGLGVLASVVVLGLGMRVGAAGGALVYEHGAASVHVQQAAPGGEAPARVLRRDHDDDDD